jgi:hypothetical protein
MPIVSKRPELVVHVRENEPCIQGLFELNDVGAFFHMARANS